MQTEAIGNIGNNNFQPAYFKTDRKNLGVWEYDLSLHKLDWSAEQFQLYGYGPADISLTDDYFLLKTTHSSDLKRISNIIDNAVKSEERYNFKRRIIRRDDTIGFVETQAVIIRSQSGKAKKILGTTISLDRQEKGSELDHNDPRFFKELYHNYHRAIYRQIFMLVQNEETAKDLCQEVFLKAWNAMSQYAKERGELYTWLLNIARNHCKDYFRSRQYRSNSMTTPLKDNFEKQDSISLENDNICIKELLFKLPLCQREVMELLFIEGHSQSEIAKIRNLPLGTVKSRSRAALKALRCLLIDLESSAMSGHATSGFHQK